jgi:hypothetical protein
VLVVLVVFLVHQERKVQILSLAQSLALKVVAELM